MRFDEKLVSRYGGRGPRYTSYPTALQFTGNFTADAYRRNAMASNDSGKPLSVYVHIPFCRSLCYYCGCNKIVTRNASRVQSYLEALYTEIGLQAALFDRVRVEPTDASFQEAIAYARSWPCDAFVAVGGGSTIDTAKAANLSAAGGAGAADARVGRTCRREPRRR